MLLATTFILTAVKSMPSPKEAVPELPGSMLVCQYLVYQAVSID
jgi:hypothetical protein